MIKINNWSCTGLNDPYIAPELITLHLQGNVAGHPVFEDGTHITSSYIVRIKGRTVETVSGSVYRLGRIGRDYRKWLKEHRPNWDWRRPITVKGA